MDIDRLKQIARMSARGLASLVLLGALVVACGDDDDDDLLDDLDTTPDMVSPTPADVTGDETPTEAPAADMTPTELDEGTPTEADDATEEGTPADDDMTPTEAVGTAEDETPTEAVGTPDVDETPTVGATPEGTPTEDDAEARTAEIGEPVTLGDLMITVEAVEKFQSSIPIVEPEPGNVFLAVEVTIENMGTDVMSVFDVLAAMHIEDETGEQHDVGLLASAALMIEDKGMFEVRMDPGDEVRGMIGFEIPETASELILVLESPDTAEVVEIDISDNDAS